VSPEADQTETEEHQRDAALLEAVRSGDDAALAELVERYAPRVLRFGMKLCRNEEDAREVLQDTLLTAARGLRSFRGESRLSTWLYTIARSFCVKRRTRGAARATFESLESADALVDPGAKPDEKLEQAGLQAALERAISGLDEAQREVLVLRDVEGLSAAEVASVLGISVEAVKSRLHRARSSVRERLLPDLEGGPPSPVPAPGCPDVLELLSRYVEGDVTGDACREMEAHVSRCAACSSRCDSLHRVLSLCSALPEPELTAGVKSAVIEEMRRVLRASRQHRPAAPA